MENLTKEQFSRDLEMELTRLDPIQENKYCLIYRSECDGAPVIIKKYRGDDSSTDRGRGQRVKLLSRDCQGRS